MSKYLELYYTFNAFKYNAVLALINLYNYVCIVLIHTALKTTKQSEAEGNLRCFHFVDKITVQNVHGTRKFHY